MPRNPNLHGRPLYGENRLNQAGASLVELPGGGYMISGFKRVDTLLYRDQLIVWRIDQEGNQIWSHTYADGSYSSGNSMVQTPDGGFLIAGSIHYGSGTKSDVWVLKINEDGDSLWSYQYGGTFSDQGRCLQSTSDNAYIITGYKNMSDLQLGDEFYLLKIDADGNELWSKTYGDEYQNHGFSVKETIDGGFIVTGQSYRSYSGNADIWILKTDPKGDTLWTRMYGMEKDDKGEIAIENHANESYLFIANVTLVVKIEDKTNYFYPFQVICLDKNGNILWSDYYSSAEHNRAYAAYITEDGKLMIGGTANSLDMSEWEIFLWKIDPATGDSIQRTSFRETETVSASTFLQTSDFGYLISGKSARAPATTAYKSYILRLNYSASTTTIYPERMNVNLDLSDAETLDNLYVDVLQDEVLGLSVMIGELLHPSTGDLEIILEHEGISVTLVDQQENSGVNFINTVFFDGASQSIQQAAAPFTGIYRPKEALSSFEGTDPGGDWTLKVIDHSAAGWKKSDDRKLNDWGLKLIVKDEGGTYVKEMTSTGNTLIRGVYPNPFNCQTRIHINLPARGHVMLEVFDIQGRKLLILADEFMESGDHQVIWDASGISPGSYIVRINSGSEFEFRKTVLVK